MKRILVTGATGFIGNYVIQALLERGHEVIATSLTPEKATQKEWFNRVTYIPFDIEAYTDNINCYQYFKEPQSMIHLAWEGLPNYNADFHILQNLPAHEKFMTNLIQNGLKDISVSGTCLEYGLQNGCLREDMPALPGTSYAQAKNALRVYLEQLRWKIPFVLKWLRLFYVYGKGQNQHSLISQLEIAVQKGDKVFNMSGGEQIRDFLPVEKMASYIVESALQTGITGIINCCSGRPVSIKQLITHYLESKGKTITLNLGYYSYPDYEPMSFWGDSSKIEYILKRS